MGIPVVASLAKSTVLPSIVTVKPLDTHEARLQVPDTSTLSSTGPVSICWVAWPSCVITTYACCPLASLYSTFTLVGTVTFDDTLELLSDVEFESLVPLPSADVSVTPVIGTFATSCDVALPLLPKAMAMITTSNTKITAATITYGKRVWLLLRPMFCDPE